MKKIKKYVQFINEQKLHRINEGGGAGKEFTFHDIEFYVAYEYKNGKLELVKNTLDIGERMDIVGYQDGLRDILTYGLFENVSEMVCNFNIDHAKEIIELGEMPISGEYTFEFTQSSSKYDTMIGAGYLSFSFKLGDVVIAGSPADVDCTLDNVDVTSFNGYKRIDEILTKAISYPDFIATYNFEHMWEDIFNPESYDDYIESNPDENMDEDEFYRWQADSLKEKYC